MKHAIIVGSGKTSRTNVEALLDDYFYINKKDVLLVLPVVSGPSQGQIYAAQYAKDKEIKTVVLAPTDTSLTGLPSCTLNDSERPLEEVFSYFKPPKDSLDVMILWDDDDPVCTEALARAKGLGITAQDLTNGLVAITPADGLVVPTPVSIPEQETLAGEFVDEEEEEMSEEDDTEDLYEALTTIIRFIAPLLVQEMKKYL